MAAPQTNQITFCLIRVSTIEHDSWALRNIWGNFPDAKTILIGDREGVFTRNDESFHQIVATKSLRAALYQFSKNPSPHLIFLRSDVIIKESVYLPDNVDDAEVFSYGRFNGGLFGLNGLKGPLPTFDFLKGEVEDWEIIQHICRTMKIPHIDFAPPEIVYSGYPLTQKPSCAPYTRIATLPPPTFPC